LEIGMYRLTRRAVTIASIATVSLLLAGGSAAQTTGSSTAAANISKIDQALWKKVKLEFVEMSLKDVASFLEDYADVKVVVDYRGLYKAKLSGDVPVTVSVADVTLASALDRMLSPIGLGWVIEGEVLMLTTDEVAATRQTTRQYYVADLAWRGGAPALVRTIVTTVDPPSWSVRGGEASIRTFDTKVVVTQTQKNHRAISRMLWQLRLRR
jgi:hypothetical protein